MRTELGSLALLLAAAAAPLLAQAQTNEDAAGSSFAFATSAEGRAILGARDDFIRATSPLERSARLQSSAAVDQDRLMRFMESTVLEWTGEEQRYFRPLIERLDRFLAGIKWKRPGRILLVQASAALEDGSPHTRANAIVLPKDVVHGPPQQRVVVMAHELFHVLSRDNAELREKLYAAIGFRRCERIDLPEPVARLRITNPDAVETRHTIAVRYRGEPVEALPFIRFRSEKIDTKAAFLAQLQIAWLLVDRDGPDCRVRAGAANEAGVAPANLQGLTEQVGRNTEYFLHPEEILADNFSLLFIATARVEPAGVPSPEILDRMRQILFQ